MTKVTIPLSGISRNTDDSISQDGQCMELINARPHNGAIEPVGRPILEKQFTEGKTPIYLHKNGSYEHVISYFNNAVVFDSVRENGTYTTKNIAICNLPGLKQINSVGNTLCMSTDESIYYAIFADGKYKYLGDKPSEPNIHIAASLDSERSYSGEIWCDIDPRIRLNKGAMVSTSLNETSITLVNNSFRSNYSKFINDIYDSGKAVYPMLIRYAIRLFDGSYIMHSAPLLIGDTNVVVIDVTKTNIDNDQLTDFTYKLSTFTSSFQIKYDLTGLSDWNDVASSVDVFVSRPITINDLEKEIDSISDYYSGTIGIQIKRKGEKELIQEISETSNFYLIKSIPIGAKSKSGLYENLFSEGNAFKNIEQKEQLRDDAFTRNKISGKMYTYNGRLHVGNIKQKFTSFYPFTMFYDKYGSPTKPLSSEVHIKTDSGLKIVHGSSVGGDTLTPYISYPDSRAVKLIVYTSDGYKEFPLKPHPFLNIAYNLSQLTPYNISEFQTGTYTELPENNTEISPNKLKVSEVSDPFYFPAKQTYTVSNRAIKGMATATTALSTGQFGQFPLYVFTDEGIFAMSTGTGDIAYTNSFPVTRDICNNPDSIISTDNAVVFSTESGLYILSGSTAAKLSSEIEGYLPTSINSSPIIKKVANVAGFTNHLSSTEFIYYLENAQIGYNYEDKEIIVANSGFPYSYVYNMQSGYWYKISVSISKFLNSYPESLAVLSDHGVYNMHNGHRTVNKILLLTRPIKFGAIVHKRILQSAIRGVIHPSQSLLYFRGETVKFRDQEILAFSNCGFYILGSNDAEHFVLLSGREKIEDIRDLITKMNKTKAYKYFMFCISGGVRTDIALSYIEALIDSTYENRLR